MVYRLRIYLFLGLFYLVSLIICITFIPTLLMPRKMAVFFYNFWNRYVVFLAKWIIGIKLEVKGLENLPQDGSPYIIASAHQSMYETFAYVLVFKGACFILKQELIRIPFFGWYLHKAGNIQIDRKGGAKILKKMQAKALAVLKEGRSIIIYPHGTRLGINDTAPLLPGVAAIYGLGEAKLYPVRVNSGICWPKKWNEFQAGTVLVEILPPLPQNLHRKEMMKLLAEKIG